MFVDKIYQNIDMDKFKYVLVAMMLQEEYPSLSFMYANTPTGLRLRVYGDISEEDFDDLNETIKSIE